MKWAFIVSPVLLGLSILASTTKPEEKPRIYVLCIGHKDCTHCKKWATAVLPQMYRLGWKPTDIAYSEFPSEKPSVPFVPLYLRFVNDRLTTYVNTVLTLDESVEFYNTGRITLPKP